MSRNKIMAVVVLLTGTVQATASDLIYKSGFETAALVSGTLSGLGAGSIELQLSASPDIETLVLAQDGIFSFGLEIQIGNPWEVQVKLLPAQHHCILSQASGNMSTGGVDDLTINCTAGDWDWDEMNWDEGGWQ